MNMFEKVTPYVANGGGIGVELTNHGNLAYNG